MDELIDHLQDEYGIGLPIADFVYSGMMASHKPHIVTATDLGDRVLPDKTLSHLLIEGSAADWQIWIDNEAPRLPLRFVAIYVRQLGDPEYMISFSNWTLNQVSDSAFELGLPADRTEIDIVAAERSTIAVGGFSNFRIWRSERVSALSAGQGFHVAVRLAQSRITMKHDRAFVLPSPFLAIRLPFFGVHNRTILSGLRANAMVDERFSGKHEARHVGPQDNQGDVAGRYFTCRNAQ